MVSGGFGGAPRDFQKVSLRIQKEFSRVTNELQVVPRNFCEVSWE